MTRRARASAVAVVSLFTLGWWTRAVPLWWSPLPATLDGFVYARHARETLAAGGVPLDGFRADAFGSTLLSSTVASVTGVRPLVLLQPLYALLGAGTVLLAFVFVRRLGRRHGWRPATVRRAGLLSGLVLATEGVFLRRSGVPDDDTLALFLIPLVVLATATYLRSRRRAWLGVILPTLAVFPFVHTFSTFLLGLALLPLGVTALVEGDTRVGALGTVTVVGGFWVYFVGYYTLVAETALTVPYVDRVSGHPGLFLAWLVVLVVGVVWFRRLRRRTRRLVVGTPLAVSLAVVLVNAQTTVFPETAATPRIVTLALLPLGLLAAVGAWASPTLGERSAAATALLGLFAAPVVTVLFSLTASLTPEFFGTVTRAQTHFHLPVVVVGAVAVARAVARAAPSRAGANAAGGDEPPTDGRAGGRQRVRAALTALLVAGFVAATLATTPVAYVNLDTGSAPSTSMESEFAAATFATDHVPGGWTSSHTQVRIATASFRGANATVAPTRRWLRGGRLPERTVFTQRSWTTTGAHLFPVGPETLPRRALERVHAEGHVVYAAGGHDPVTGVRPRRTPE